MASIVAETASQEIGSRRFDSLSGLELVMRGVPRSCDDVSGCKGYLASVFPFVLNEVSPKKAIRDINRGKTNIADVITYDFLISTVQNISNDHLYDVEHVLGEISELKELRIKRKKNKPRVSNEKNLQSFVLGTALLSGLNTDVAMSLVNEVQDMQSAKSLFVIDYVLTNDKEGDYQGILSQEGTLLQKSLFLAKKYGVRKTVLEFVEKINESEVLENRVKKVAGISTCFEAYGMMEENLLSYVTNFLNDTFSERYLSHEKDVLQKQVQNIHNAKERCRDKYKGYCIKVKKDVDARIVELISDDPDKIRSLRNEKRKKDIEKIVAGLLKYNPVLGNDELEKILKISNIKSQVLCPAADLYLKYDALSSVEVSGFDDIIKLSTKYDSLDKDFRNFKSLHRKRSSDFGLNKDIDYSKILDVVALARDKVREKITSAVIHEINSDVVSYGKLSAKFSSLRKDDCQGIFSYFTRNYRLNYIQNSLSNFKERFSLYQGLLNNYMEANTRRDRYQALLEDSKNKVIGLESDVNEFIHNYGKIRRTNISTSAKSSRRYSVLGRTVIAALIPIVSGFAVYNKCKDVGEIVEDQRTELIREFNEGRYDAFVEDYPGYLDSSASLFYIDKKEDEVVKKDAVVVYEKLLGESDDLISKANAAIVDIGSLHDDGLYTAADMLSSDVRENIEGFKKMYPKLFDD